MAVELFIHKMSEHMDTARIVQWLVKEGETVRQFQILMEVETDKAVAELEFAGCRYHKRHSPWSRGWCRSQGW